MIDLSRFEVLTFDCYGTLIDWEKGILAAVKPVFARHGIDAGDDAVLERYAALETKYEHGEYTRYRLVLRLVMTEFSLRFRFDAEPGELDCLARSIGEWEPFPDTVTALRRLAARYRLAVISNIDDDLFALSAKRLGVAFDWVTTAGQVGAYKPSPAMFEEALRRIGRPRERVLHVAQSVYHDIVPARRLGLATVWVNRRSGKTGAGATPPAEGEPDIVVPDLAALADLAGC